MKHIALLFGKIFLRNKLKLQLIFNWMTYLDEILKSRRDTRHFTNDAVPDEVIIKHCRRGMGTICGFD
jgi:hypothetical protein